MRTITMASTALALILTAAAPTLAATGQSTDGLTVWTTEIAGTTGDSQAKPTYLGSNTVASNTGQNITSKSAAITWVAGVAASAIVFAVGKPLQTDMTCQHAGDYERATLLSFATLVERLIGGGLLMVASSVEHAAGPNGILMGRQACGLLLAGFAWRSVGSPQVARRTAYPPPVGALAQGEC